ncbi:hypothetical protein D3C76_1517800 [compost metagenome]
MIGRDHNDRIFKVRRGFDFFDQRRDMLLATAHRAERLIRFTVNRVALALAGAGDKAIRVVGIYRQCKQREAFAGLRQLLEFFPGFIQHRVVVEAPVVAVCRVRDGGF